MVLWNPVVIVQPVPHCMLHIAVFCFAAYMYTQSQSKSSYEECPSKNLAPQFQATRSPII